MKFRKGLYKLLNGQHGYIVDYNGKYFTGLRIYENMYKDIINGDLSALRICWDENGISLLGPEYSLVEYVMTERNQEIAFSDDQISLRGDSYPSSQSIRDGGIEKQSHIEEKNIGLGGRSTKEAFFLKADIRPVHGKKESSEELQRSSRSDKLQTNNEEDLSGPEETHLL